MLKLDIVLCSQAPKVQESFPSHAFQAQTATLCTQELNWWLAGYIWQAVS